MFVNNVCVLVLKVCVLVLMIHVQFERDGSFFFQLVSRVQRKSVLQLALWASTSPKVIFTSPNKKFFTSRMKKY